MDGLREDAPDNGHQQGENPTEPQHLAELS